ncbi:hypothetical protein [Cellulomonas edaphi]|uniref:Uncharacterized protein n=1 Tax=Cellulomonas edaphi TaxID=3053468 RepID=A0ABT7S520_9CELL|nr:hypothetical protein [Cellulomons edaphi]MDM7830705.1 hypothetical protein [Cellulomons edaphi]
MTTDVTDAPGTAAEVPPRFRPSRALRGLLVVITSAALLVAVATVVDWGWRSGRSTDAWAGRFGDPAMTLADGTALPASPPTITRWMLEPTTYGLPDDTSVLAAAFGGPVVAVDAHTWATATGTVEFSALDSVLADPTSPMNTGPTFTGATSEQVPAAPTFTTEKAQLDEVRRLLAVVGWPADAPVRGFTSGSGRAFSVRPPVPEAAITTNASVFPAPRVEFAADGSLSSVRLQPWALTRPAEQTAVRSAEQALDDLRHHRSAVAWWEARTTPNLVERVVGSPFFSSADDASPTGPIASITLYGDCTGVLGQTHPCWVFLDADGNHVGTVLAAEDDVYPPGLR